MKNRYLSLIIILIICNLTTYYQLVNGQTAEHILPNDKCLSCHKEMEILPENFNYNDIHLQEGLSCAGCHGGDPAAEDMDKAMDRGKGYIGVPSLQEVPQFCGKCHSNINIMRIYQPRIATDQVQQYYTSIHGQRLQQGDQKVAECVGCHTAHTIFPAKDTRSSVYPIKVPTTCQKCHGDAEYMKEYNLPTNQFDEYVQSIHGINLLEKNDIGSPACNDCHGNHGAIPPGVESISHVCGGCHINNMDYFLQSSMAKVFTESDIHACEKCHGYHKVLKTNDEMIGVGESSVCIDCHLEGDKGYETAQKIYAYIKNFVTSYDSANTKLSEVQQKGMDDVDMLFLLQEANQDLIHSRTIVHTFDDIKIQEKTSEGIQKTKKAIQLSEEQINDYYFRRYGFSIAIIFIVILIITLYIKIRKMEQT
jgi:hypothetical protein